MKSNGDGASILRDIILEAPPGSIYYQTIPGDDTFPLAFYFDLLDIPDITRDWRADRYRKIMCIFLCSSMMVWLVFCVYLGYSTSYSICLNAASHRKRPRGQVVA